MKHIEKRSPSYPAQHPSGGLWPCRGKLILTVYNTWITSRCETCRRLFGAWLVIPEPTEMLDDDYEQRSNWGAW